MKRGKFLRVAAIAAGLLLDKEPKEYDEREFIRNEESSRALGKAIKKGYEELAKPERREGDVVFDRDGMNNLYRNFPGINTEEHFEVKRRRLSEEKKEREEQGKNGRRK